MGGYGKVYKAQNKMDDIIYAVKKIRISIKPTDEAKLATVRREVLVMACLKHCNIVTYFSSWWEMGSPTACKDGIESIDASISSNSPFLVDTKSSSNNGNFRNAKHQGVPVTLYVQMELCKITLEEYIKERNSTLIYYADKDPLDVVDAEFSNSIFQQILLGVEYIHSQSMMHRDLKPSNVFVDRDRRQVKIGDFGLARNEWTGPIEELEVGPYTPFEKCSSTMNFTAKLGTESYAAPEQLGGSNYDKKADMYSLGLINFELFYPFGTNMERAKMMQSLRQHEGCIPEVHKIQEKWPIQAEIIQKLLCINSCKRPSATDLLGLWPTKSEKDIIRELQEQLRIKDGIIKHLGNRISNQEVRNKRLEKQKKKLRKLVGFLMKNKQRHCSGDASGHSE